MKAEFYNVNEIRMGSPYFVVEKVRVEGWEDEFEEQAYQNLWCYADELKIGVLIKWDINENNEPGFRPILLSLKKQKSFELDRIQGCCANISIEKQVLRLDVFQHPNRKEITINLNKYA
jgi:hypothetical protein